MTDIFTATMPTKGPVLPRVTLPRLEFGATHLGLTQIIAEAYAEVYMTLLFGISLHPVTRDEGCEDGRDPNW